MSLAACAEIVRRADPDRFLAAMAAPPETRAVLFPLYAFNIEVARAPWVTAEPLIAEMRLQFWRDVLDGIAQGAAPPAHEVAAPLHAVLDPEGARALDGLVTARQWDIGRAAFADQAAFDAYIDATSGHLAWAGARALGAPGSAEGPVRAHAYASGLAAFLRAVPALEAAGRIPLVDGTPQGVRDLADLGLAALARARRQRRAVPGRARAALLAGWRAGVTLRAARDLPERVIEGKLDESEFARRARLIWVATTGRW